MGREQPIEVEKAKNVRASGNHTEDSRKHLDPERIPGGRNWHPGHELSAAGASMPRDQQQVGALGRLLLLESLDQPHYLYREQHDVRHRTSSRKPRIISC